MGPKTPLVNYSQTAPSWQFPFGWRVILDTPENLRGERDFANTTLRDLQAIETKTTPIPHFLTLLNRNWGLSVSVS